METREKVEKTNNLVHRALWVLVLLITILLIAGKLIAGTQGQLQITRIAIVVIAALSGGVALFNWRTSIAYLRQTFCARDSATNVAIFRIINFATIWWLLYHEPIFGPLECKESWTIPVGIGWLFNLSPPQESVVRGLWIFSQVLCACGILGIYTRTSALLLALLSTYIFGIPACMQVRHIHHIVWFSLLLSVTRSSDKLSIPVALGMQSPRPERSVEYGMPLRFLWLMFGIIYFFPGLMKIWNVGIDWIWTDNLKNIILSRLYKRALDFPIFDFIHGDLFWEFSALVAILLEVGFIFLVLNGERARGMLLFVALVFHNMNEFLIRVGFQAFQTYLLTLINWYRFFLVLGKMIFPRRVVVHFERDCKRCRCVEFSIRSFDLLRRVTPTHQMLVRSEFDFHASNHSGELIVEFFERVPLAIPSIIFSVFWQHCISSPKAPAQRCGAIPRGVLIMSLSLVAITSSMGLAHSSSSWPFSAYPFFDYRSDGIITKYSLEVKNSDGKGLTLWMNRTNPKLRAVQINEVLMFSQGAPPEKRRKVFVTLCHNAYINSGKWQQMNDVEGVEIFKNTIKMTEDNLNGSLISKEKVCEFSNNEWR